MHSLQWMLVVVVASFLAARVDSREPSQGRATSESKSQPEAAEKALTVKVELPDLREHVKFEQDYRTYAGFVTLYHRAGYLDVDHFRRIQPEMIISAPYLQYALWWKGLAKLHCLKDSKEPVRWLRQNLKAELLDGPSLSLRWVGKPIPEAARIVKDVAEVYAEEGLDRRFSKRAWRMAYLQKVSKTVTERISTYEEFLTSARYRDNPKGKAEALKLVQVNRAVQKQLAEQLEAVSRGDDPPLLCFEEATNLFPVRVDSPELAKTDKVWLADYGNAKEPGKTWPSYGEAWPSYGDVTPTPLEDDIPGSLKPAVELYPGGRLSPLRFRGDTADRGLTATLLLPDLRKHVKFEQDYSTYASFVAFYHRASYLDLDHYRRIQPQLIIAAPYLQYALWWKGLAKLAPLKDSKEPVRWLRQNLKAELVDGPAVALRWVGKPIREAAQIVKVVAEVYAEEGLDRRYSKRAWRMAYLQHMANGMSAALAERERWLTNPESNIAELVKSLEVYATAKKQLRDQFNTLSRGDDPLPLYFQQTGHGPVRVKPPKGAKPDMVSLADYGNEKEPGKVWLHYGSVIALPLEDDIAGTLGPFIELHLRGPLKQPTWRK